MYNLIPESAPNLEAKTVAAAAFAAGSGSYLYVHHHMYNSQQT